MVFILFATLSYPCVIRQQAFDLMLPSLQPAGLVRRLPLLPHQMVDRQTKTPDVIVLCHFGVPKLNVETWRVAIDGLVERPIAQCPESRSIRSTNAQAILCSLRFQPAVFQM